MRNRALDSVEGLTPVRFPLAGRRHPARSVDLRQGRAACESLEARTLLAASPGIVGFTLINADTDQPIAAFADLRDGAVLNFSDLPTSRLNIRANVSAGTQSVKFGYDSKSNFRVESGAPFALASNDGADYFAWTPSLGSHTLVATPYSAKKAGGIAGNARTLKFTVVQSDTWSPHVPSVTTASTGTNLIRLNIAPATASDEARTLNYRITYTAGDYLPGAAGEPHTIEAPASARHVELSGLQPFTLYSINFTAVDSSGREAATRVGAWTTAPATLERYLYSFDLPKERKGFKTLTPQIQVFDVAHGNRWVRNIPLPSGIFNVRGVAASAVTGRLYLSFFDSFKDGYQPGGLLCMDLKTDTVLWVRHYDKSVVPSPDRFDITPDGKTIYMPVGENGPDNFWVVIDASNGDPVGRINHVTAPHNTIVSLDGRLAFFEGQEKGPAVSADRLHTVAVVDTTTNKIVQRVGPFKDVVRPFTVNGSGSLVFATLNNFVGFQIGDVASGRVIYTAAPPGYTQPTGPAGEVYSHGIALTPDEKQVWVADRLKVGIHVWDVSNVPSGPPKYLGFIATRKTGLGLNGKVDPAASNDTNSVPQWITASYDGKYMYAESGDIIEVATRRVIGTLRGKTKNAAGALVDAPYTHSRHLLEVQWDGDELIRVTKQFAIGRLR